MNLLPHVLLSSAASTMPTELTGMVHGPVNELVIL